MIRQSSSALALLFPVVLFGCGRKAEPPPVESEKASIEPAAKAASAEPGGNACPPIPFWAAELPEGVFAELLHIPAKRAKRNGAGYRLHEDGRYEVYTDVELFVNSAGKAETRPIEGVWKMLDGIEGTNVEAIRVLVNESPRGELEQWAPKRKSKNLDIESTLLRVRQGDELIASCYFGDRAPPPLGKIERAIHDLRINRKVPPSEQKAKEGHKGAKGESQKR